MKEDCKHCGLHSYMRCATNENIDGHDAHDGSLLLINWQKPPLSLKERGNADTI
jgi:hypothetical protein